SNVVTYDNQNNEEANAIALDSQGNIYIAGRTSANNGDVLLLKYQSDGSPDGSFGSNGVVTFNQNGDEQAFSIAIDNNGDIYIAGEISLNNNRDVLVLKYKPDGSRDNTFGNQGVVTFNNTQEGAVGIAIVGNHLYVTGSTRDNNNILQALLLRFFK
ncbi:MAG: SBBP repeat-containing protein, partial [bacterium]